VALVKFAVRSCYDTDPADADANGNQSCAQHASLGCPGTVSPNDTPPDNPNSHCAPVEDTGTEQNTNKKGEAIMKCCSDTANNGIYVPCVSDCHNKVNNCLGAGGGYNPFRHPRFGPPVASPVFDPLPY
jgi:hypothetical protein